ncbi:helix-turn-helix domain-containing protein [Loigolactobacillus zhaoyuanensis]|uniref:helix-turn-helix domain-containing protein n=1 Tax=Loigolactobacillus zhaoyuanensis TaxID=2486017 RepID=UPI000F73C729|nr:helix-turn-helix domain-containing protein [Loigolactobacillus zhaoyuanensis]
MDFEQMMLNDRTYQYFRIYSTLISMPAGVYSINDIAQRVELPYPKAYKLTQGLVDELALIDPKAAALIADNGSLDTAQLTVDLNTLRYHLISNQLPYQAIYYLVTEDEPSIDDFCKRYETSRATVFRKIKPLNDQLHNFGLHFTFSRMNIVGDERKTILFLFCIFRLATEGVIWPFAEHLQDLALKVRDQFMTRLQVPSEFENSDVFPLILALTSLRMHQGNYVEDDPCYDILLDDNDNYDARLLDTEVISDRHYPELTSDRKQAILHFGYQLLNILPIFRKEDAYLQTTLDYFYSRNNIVQQFATEFLDYMQENSFKMSKRLVLDKILLGNVINVGLTSYLFDGVVPTLSIIANSERNILTGGYDYADLYHEIGDYIDHLPEKYADFRGDREQTTQALYHLLLPIYSEYKQEYHIRVGLMIPGDSMVYRRYLDLYSGFKYIDIEPYDATDFADYDLIFTSSISFYLDASNSTDDRVFYFHQGSAESEISPLLRAREFYLKKYPTLPNISAIY